MGNKFSERTNIDSVVDLPPNLIKGVSIKIGPVQWRGDKASCEEVSEEADQLTELVGHAVLYVRCHCQCQCFEKSLKKPSQALQELRIGMRTWVKRIVM